MVRRLVSFSGFIGHALKDALQYGSPWWTWVLVSGLIGLAIGLLAKKINIEKSPLTVKIMFGLMLYRLLLMLLVGL